MVADLIGPASMIELMRWRFRVRRSRGRIPWRTAYSAHLACARMPTGRRGGQAAQKHYYCPTLCWSAQSERMQHGRAAICALRHATRRLPRRLRPPLLRPRAPLQRRAWLIPGATGAKYRPTADRAECDGGVRKRGKSRSGCIRGSRRSQRSDRRQLARHAYLLSFPIVDAQRPRQRGRSNVDACASNQRVVGTPATATTQLSTTGRK